jgi:transposase InsO family protein
MYFWWKNVDQDIENCVKQCFACQSCVNVPRKEITYQWEKTTYPFERIHLDFFYFKSSNFLLLVDSFSKFIEVWEMKKTDAYNVKNILRRFFSIFGLPDLVVADNGPPFNSSEFREFLHNNNIDYKNSPVYHPQSNGLAERAVQTIKNKLKKFCSDLKYKNLNTNQKLDLILFSYRNTPTTTTNKTPSELLFNYKQKTLLNSIIKKEKCKIIDSKNHSGELKNDNCTNGNQINKAINFSFSKGEKVLYRLHYKDFVKWKPAIIKEKISSCTYKILLEGSIKFVHINQLRKSNLDDKYHFINYPNINIQDKNEIAMDVDVETEILNNDLETEIVNNDLETEIVEENSTEIVTENPNRNLVKEKTKKRFRENESLIVDISEEKRPRRSHRNIVPPKRFLF